LYGLAHLARGDVSGRWVPLSEICADHHLPRKHLAKIFQVLVRAGLLESARGSRGGFALARPPKRISLLEVIEAVEGRSDGECLLASECEGLDACPVGRAIGEARTQRDRVLGRRTLADVAPDGGKGRP